MRYLQPELFPMPMISVGKVLEPQRQAWNISWTAQPGAGWGHSSGRTQQHTCLKILAAACPTPVYAVADVPLLATACTWNSSLIRSKGAVAVLATAPAAPPARNILAEGYRLFRERMWPGSKKTQAFSSSASKMRNSLHGSQVFHIPYIHHLLLHMVPNYTPLLLVVPAPVEPSWGCDESQNLPY